MILYHYCSTQTFHSILDTGTLRLSSLTQSNDYLEGKLVAESVARIAKSEGLADDETARIQDEIARLESTFSGLGFCLSEEGDLLSQWRGYAVDGTGVAIGFEEDYLEWLAGANADEKMPSIRLARVEYELEAHDGLVRETYQEMKRLMESGDWARKNAIADLLAEDAETSSKVSKKAVSANMNISLAALRFLDHLYLLKSPGFREEREWRLISHLIADTQGRIGYRPSGNQLIPYRTCKMGDPGQTPISRVVLGPKHKTPTSVVESFLRQANLGDITVSRSSTSYR